MQFLGKNKVLALTLTASLLLALLVPSLAMGTNLFDLRSNEAASVADSAASAADSAEESAAESEAEPGKTVQALLSTAQGVKTAQASGASNYAAGDATGDEYEAVTVNYGATYSDYENNEYYYEDPDSGKKYLVTGLACSRSWWFGYTYSWTITYTYKEGTETKEGTATSSDSSITLYKRTVKATYRYFPVTLYNYDDRINNATHQLEVNAALASDAGISSLTEWQGIYFGGNDHGANVTGSDSYIYGEETTSYTNGDAVTVNYTSDNDYSKYEKKGYYYLSGSSYYLVTDISCTYSSRRYNWTITCGTNTFSTSGRTQTSITLYARSVTLPYANWNKWTGEFATHGNKTYSGLVEPNLVNGLPVFTKTDAGIFNNDATVKDIYTNVGLPVSYNGQYYIFNADTYAAYFHDDTTQGASSTPASNTNLYYSSTAQSHNFPAQDGRTNGWFPFNDAASVTTGESGTADYFFGMQASIPFTMTTTGTISSTDSTPVTFNFSGDDDVWVFIDGVLVLDIGGVHNEMKGDIDFAANTWTISETANASSHGTAADVNNAPLSGQLFNVGDTTGVLNQTRESFAAKDSHELTIFYLERGAGSSNSMIKFNLPQKDSVVVTKAVNTKDSANEALSEDVLAAINEQSFTFRLYKNGEAVGTADYRVYKDGSYQRTATTAADGTFSLKNGESARFVGEIDATGDGDSYYVVETEKDGWQDPKWSYTVDPSGSGSQTAAQSGQQSQTVTVTGSDGTESLSFLCTNTLTHVYNCTLQVENERVVIDYGLPVEVDVLKNDVVLYGTITDLTVNTTPVFGTVTVTNDKKLVYKPNKPLTAVEKISYTVTATKNEDAGKDPEPQTATLYIIPATSMYYEENFGSLVTFSDGWSQVGTAHTDYQEAGFVGTSASPYGSDPAYLNDSGDSNGSSYYVDAATNGALFSYEFTGTGTTFFARTFKNSGYMRVVVTDLSTNAVVSTLLRDTSYKADDVVNYNIPVFTMDGLDYGRYRVTVALAKAIPNSSFGTKFYLDGIRVINPIDPSSTSAEDRVAFDAYAADYEHYGKVVTIREKLLSDATNNIPDGTIEWKGEGFIVFTDSNGTITTAEEYKSNGPKEEVYLNNGQSITFSLAHFDRNTMRLYIGLKAPRGSAVVSVNGHELTLSNAADCYFDVSDYAVINTVDEVPIATFTVTAGESSFVSATNIKVTGDADFVIVNQEDINGDESDVSQ